MGVVRVTAILASSRPIEAYGGMQLDEKVIRDLAEATAGGQVPMTFAHDTSRPVPTANVEAGVRRAEDGYLQVWAAFDVDQDAWNDYQRELQGHSAAGGMSVTFLTPLDGEEERQDGAVAVAGDAHYFTDDEIRRAAEVLQAHDPEAVGLQLYQLSFVPVLRVIFDLTMNFVVALGPNLAASVIYDAAKGLLRPGQRNSFDVTFKETRRGGRVVKVAIKVDSDEGLRKALDRLPDVLESGARGTFVYRGDGYDRVDPEAPGALDTDGGMLEVEGSDG